jgi:hypothetical protein
MRFKGTTALFIVFVLLGAYVYFTEYRGREQRQKQEEAGKKVIQAEQKDIKEISLVYPDRTISAVRQGEKQWQITNPPGIEADPDEWDQLASSLTTVDRKDTVAQNPQDLAPFGLKDPAVRVVAKLTDGKTVEVSFGAENPKKTDNYAKLAGGSDVFLTASSSAHTFTKTISDLRNKKILDFQIDDIDHVNITAENKEIDIQKSGQDWQLKKPVDAKADATEVSTLLSSIGFARATGFAEPTVDARQAGLEPAPIRISVHDGKKKTDRVLLIGKMPEAGKYYARDASRDAIFIIDKEIPDKLRRPLVDWRDKSVTQLNRDKIDHIEIGNSADRFSFAKSGSDWILPDNRKLQWDKVSGMLNTLEFEKAKDVIDVPKPLQAYGLDKPKLEAVFREGSNEVLRISFGADSTSADGVYVKTSDSPAVKLVSKDLFDKFNVKVEDLLEAKPATGK